MNCSLVTGVPSVLLNSSSDNLTECVHDTLEGGCSTLLWTRYLKKNIEFSTIEVP